MHKHTEARPQTANRILNALTRSEFESLSAHFDPVNLLPGEILCSPHQPITHVYFPNRGTVSVISPFKNGATVEVGMVGNEGMFGVCVVLGSISTPLTAQVQLPGDALRMRAEALQRELGKCGQLQDLLLRYTQAFITQIAQTAACNRLHTIEQHLRRWLLLSHDRIASDELVMTQELIANMLGVRREGVTAAARSLQSQGLIRYVRGRIWILDRPGLEASACECYRVVKDEYDRLLG